MKFAITQRSYIDCGFQVAESYVTGAAVSSRFGDHFIKISTFFLNIPKIQAITKQ
jgi:hypothetical protein